MSIRRKLSIALVLSSFAIAPVGVHAKEFFIATGGSPTGYSEEGECKVSPSGKWSGGCSIFYDGSDCSGYSIWVADQIYTQMIASYNNGETITIRHLNSNGSFGEAICQFN